MTYKQTVASFNPATAITYCGDGVHGEAVNSDAITIDGASIAANQTIISGMGAGPWKITNGIRYREQTITLKLRGSWDDSIADVGFNEIVSGNLTPIYMSDSDPSQPNIPTDKAWPLNGSGVGENDSTLVNAESTARGLHAQPRSRAKSLASHLFAQRRVP